MKKTLSILSVIFLVLLSSCDQKKNIAPGPNADVSASDETTAQLTEDQTAENTAVGTEDDTNYDYELKYETIAFRYQPLDPTEDDDIYAACVSGCAELDGRFRQENTAAFSGIRDRETYTEAEIGQFFVDGDRGTAIAFMRFLPVPEPEFQALHPDYYFVLRTTDYGKTWYKSANAFCFYMYYLQSLYFDNNLFLFGYTEVNGGSSLFSNDNMDTCTLNKKISGQPPQYYTAIRVADDKKSIILTSETTNNGFFFRDGSEKHSELTLDLQMNLISSKDID